MLQRELCHKIPFWEYHAKKNVAEIVAQDAND